MTDRKRTSTPLLNLGRRMARRIFLTMFQGVEKVSRVIDFFKALPQKARNHARVVFNADYAHARFKHIGCDYRRRGKLLKFSANLKNAWRAGA